MQKRTLGKTGLSVSILGLGTAPAAYLGADAKKFGDLLNQLLDAGLNLIDTAASYPGSEKTLDELISHRRNEFFLVSKCGQAVEGVTGEAWSASVVSQSVDLALKNLGTDRIEVMLLHSCDLATLKKGDALGALVKAKQAGKIKHVGYSGDNDAAAYAVTMPDIEVLETSVNLVDQINLDKAIPGAMKNNIGVIAKRPIANAAWKDLSAQPGMYKNYAKAYTERLSKLPIKPQDFGLTDWAELALRFTLSQPGVATAIIGTTNPKNAAANVAAANEGPLAAGAVQEIRKAIKKADPNGTWTGQQ